MTILSSLSYYLLTYLTAFLLGATVGIGATVGGGLVALPLILIIPVSSCLIVFVLVLWLQSVIKMSVGSCYLFTNSIICEIQVMAPGLTMAGHRLLNSPVGSMHFVISENILCHETLIWIWICLSLNPTFMPSSKAGTGTSCCGIKVEVSRYCISS